MPNEDGEQVVNTEVVEETTPSEATTEETNSPEVVEEAPSVQSDDGELHKSEPESDDAEEDSDEKPQTRADKRKEQLQSEIDELERQAETPKQDQNAEIRDLVARRNELRQQVEQRNAEVYQPASVDDLLEQVNPETNDYYTRSEAKIAALEQKLELKDYNNRVADAQIAIESDVNKVLNDFPMFNPQSPEFNQEVAAQVGNLLAQSIQTDPNTGEVIGSSIPIYQLYKTHAVAAQASARNAKIQGQKATEKMLSQADTITGGQGQRKTFAQMSLAEKEAYLRKKGHDV